METTTGQRWVAVASSPPEQVWGTVTLHSWDGGHRLGEPVASIDLPRPSWLTWSPDGRRLHVACESDSGQIVTLVVDESSGGAPTLNRGGQASTGGASPCHLALMPDGLTLVAANYGDGVVSTIALDDGIAREVRDTAQLVGSGPNPIRQERSHAHQVVPLPDSRLAVVDLGADEIVTYAVRNTELHHVTSSAMPSGAGPRHLARDARTGRAWVGGELSGTVIALRETGEGGFAVVSETLASTSDVANHVAHIWADPRGERLLISNRGPDTVSLFDVTQETPVLLAEVGVPAHPRHFHVDGRVLLVAGRDADAVTTHEVSRDGVTRPVTTLTVPAPMCIVPRPGSAAGSTIPT